MRKKQNKCQQSLVLIKHSVQTDSALDAAATWELAVIENKQNKIKQTLVHVTLKISCFIIKPALTKPLLHTHKYMFDFLPHIPIHHQYDHMGKLVNRSLSFAKRS